MEDVLKSGYLKSLLGFENFDWFVDEIIKLENRMNFYLKNTKEDIIMTQQDEEDFENNICRFCGKNVESDKVRDHCYLTGKYRGRAHSLCNFNVKQAQSNFITVMLHNFCNYDCNLFFKM